MAPSSYHVLEIFSLPEGCAKMEEEDRRKVIKGMVKSAGPEGFAENANAHTASISPAAELSVCIVMFWLMGGPFIGLGLLVYFAIFMPLSHFAALCAFFALLAFHPLPDVSSAIANSWFAEANYKYFSYRFVWTDDAVDEIAKIPAWIGAGAPHGVMPFSNLLSIPAINTFTFRKFKGAAASALFRTPMLRYFTALGCTSVSAGDITEAVDAGYSIGIVVDGIAGIFRNNHDDEVVAVKDRKGLAKLALRTGTPLVAAYSVGNTEVYSAGFDGWGVMEWLSRKLQMSLFFLWGRFYLPIPNRRNVALLFGKPIMVQKKPLDEITQKDIDELHAKLLASMSEIFDLHKGHLGCAHKKIVFE
mmetsp:Transcript_7354/g.14283  ORF Transcript_7354/g.14283 Transcript_7354/m.14283 type:complete len:360 (-) Transcript_7354:118-1197(-)